MSAWLASFFDRDDNRYDVVYDCSRARVYANVADFLRDTRYEFADVFCGDAYAFTVDKDGRLHFDDGVGQD